MADNTQQPGWTYNPDGQQTSPESPAEEPTQAEEPVNLAESEPTDRSEPDTQDISWTASEFVHNHKTVSWYLLFFLAIGLIIALIYLLTKDVISAFVIGFAGLLFAILASHKPRQLEYVINGSGIKIGDKFHPYSSFKSFDLAEEGVIGSINLLPLKRFMPELTIYYPAEEQEKIISVLSEHLPHDQREEHHVDKLLKKIRF